MKLIRIEMPVELHSYLTDVVRQHSRNGHEPEEGLILFHLWDVVTKRAQVVEMGDPMTATLAPTAPPPQPPNGTVHEDGSVEMREVHSGVEAVYNNDTPHC